MIGCKYAELPCDWLQVCGAALRLAASMRSRPTIGCKYAEPPCDWLQVLLSRIAIGCRYQKLWKQYMKQKHLVANKPKVALKDREKLNNIEDQLQEIRLKGSGRVNCLSANQS